MLVYLADKKIRVFACERHCVSNGVTNDDGSGLGGIEQRWLNMVEPFAGIITAISAAA